MNVVRKEADGLVFDLAGEEIIFPLLLDQEGIGVVAFFHMDAIVSSHEVKAFLNDMYGGAQVANMPGEVEHAPGDERGCYEFVDKHFRLISGIEGDATQEDMRAFLDANPQLKVRLLKEGYDGIRLDVDEAAPGKLVLMRPTNTTVKVKRLLYCPAGEKIVEVRYKHVLRKETEEDRIKHKRALRMVEKGPKTFVRVNFDVLEQLYDNLVQRIDGMTIDGAPCTEANKSDWIKQVSLFDKVFAVNRVFSKIAVKNA